MFNILRFLTVCALAVTGFAHGSPSTEVLLYGPTLYSGTSSQEASVVTALGLTPVIVSAATFAGMSTTDFESYRAIVFGDPDCSTSRSILESTPAGTTSVWGPAVTGNVFLFGSDEVWHARRGKPAAKEVTENGIAYAVDSHHQTGLYMSLSCYYHGTSPGTVVPALSHFGTFSVRGVGCYNSAHIVAVHPAMTTLDDTDLSGWSCSVHEAFDSFPSGFLPLAIAKGISGPGSMSFADGSSGVPYALARGEGLSPVKCGDGVLDVDFEECDDGNVVSGDGCSSRCTIEKSTCGDGTLDAGEDCDDGNNVDGDGCSHDCRRENRPPDCSGAFPEAGSIWPPNHKPVPVEIHGVTDPDGDVVDVVVTSIFQDEVVKGKGSGKTCPDAWLDPPKILAERSGNPPKNGRVYHLGYTATDPSGASCSGSVTICVPHDLSGSGCVDEGPLFSSTDESSCL